MESGWMVLPEELLPKVLQRLLSSVRLRTEAGVQGPGHGAADVQWVEVPPRRTGDAAAAETGCHRRGAPWVLRAVVRRGSGVAGVQAIGVTH